KDKNKNLLYTVLSLGAVLAIYTVLPMFARDCIPHDMIENLYWGKEMQFGYDKHPFLFAWISYGFFRLFGNVPESMYLLTQLNMALGMFFIYKIGRMFLGSRDKALMSLLLFSSTLIVSLGNQKLNANTILISLLPMAFYLFARFAERPTIANSALFGASCGLAVMGKYFAALPIFAFAAVYFCKKSNRQSFSTIYPYIAVLSFLAIVSWNFIWLWQHDFVSFQYAFDKAAGTPDALEGRVKYPLQYLLGQVVTVLPALLIIYRRRRGGAVSLMPSFRFGDYRKFMVEFVFVVPLAAMFVIPLLLNIRIGEYWATPLWYLFGTYILMKNDIKLDVAKVCRYVLILNIFIALISLTGRIVMRKHALKHPEKTVVAFFNAREAADYITVKWRERFGAEKPIKYLVADKMTHALAVYLPDNPSLYLGEGTPSSCYLATWLVSGEQNARPGLDGFDFTTKNGHKIRVEFMCQD
ncbi:MAG: glycosyltransferase family 39 protein, partial [Rickettsiales bacterium]|nr:glycosyltransferase family 39 protein [Rickettsiales bacterium]